MSNDPYELQRALRKVTREKLDELGVDLVEMSHAPAETDDDQDHAFLMLSIRPDALMTAEQKAEKEALEAQMAEFEELMKDKPDPLAWLKDTSHLTDDSHAPKSREDDIGDWMK